MRFQKEVSAAAGWIGIVLLVGCRTPPNVGPFAEATAALSAAVATFQGQVAAEIRSTHDDSQELKQRAGELATQFEEEWGKRVRAMKALSDYTEALVDVVHAGQEGRETAAQIGTAVNAMLKEVADSYPAGSVATEAITKTVATLYGKYAEHQAATSVAEAADFADPIVQEISILLAQDLRSMETILTSAKIHALQASTAMANNVAANGFQNLSYWNTLQARRDDLRNKVALQPEDAGLAAKLGSVEALIDVEMRRPWYLEYTADTKAVTDRFEGYLAAVAQAELLLRAWGESHAAIVWAAKNNVSPGFRVLLQLTSELITVYQEARKR